MNNSKFRAIPENNNFEIPFKLEKKPLLEWLNTLSSMESKVACLQLLRLLQTLNKANISSKKRLVFLTIIADYLKSYVNHLEGVCWDVGFPLTIDERVYAEAITWNYLLLSEGFFIAAEDTITKQEAAFSLAIALQAKRQAQLHIAAVYSLPNDGFWKEVYQMFIFAEKRKFLDIKIKRLKDITVASIFKKLFIFQACDTNQFRARDMQTIFYFLDNICDKVAIQLQIDQEFSYFAFDLDADNPPFKVNDDANNTTSVNIRYFSPIIVAHEIYDTLKRGTTWTGTIKSINTTLFLRVIKTLGLGQKRRYTRLNDGHQVLGVIGFEDIVNFLRKNKTISPNNFLESDVSSQKTKDVTGELKLYIKNKNLTKKDKNLSQETLIDSIWQVPESIDINDTKDVNVKKIHIFDSSAKGYSVYWNDSNTKIKAKIGDVFGIISKDEKRLEIALIRRIAMSEGDNFRFGAEVIGFESEVVYICHPDDKDRYIWAIFIPGIKVLGQADTLIFSIGSFKAGDGIYIYKDKQKIQGLVVKELHSTSGIILVELAYPSEDENNTLNK
jgi:hypothetical protein